MDDSVAPAARARLLALLAEAPPAPALPERYRPIEKIGQGAMGAVYRAEDTVLKREVALKVIARAHLAGPGELERFRREALAMAKVDHPNVVKVFDTGELNGNPYLVMELVVGDTLDAAFARRPMRARVELIERVARGVQAVHASGIVHRDLKPKNVVVDAQGEPHVMDFGLARLAGSSTLTRDGTAMGTPPYMAPEQIRGGAVDGRTDVYALGAILYEGLTSRVPHPGRSVADKFHAVLTEDPIPPRTLNARIAPDLETICLKAIDKDPARRYATSQALGDDLRRWLDGEAIEARPPSPAFRLKKALRRRRAVVIPSAVAIAGALAVMTALLLALPPVRRVEGHWRDAEERASRAAALARVSEALERAIDLVHDGAAPPEAVRHAAERARRVADEVLQKMPALAEARHARGRALHLLGDEAAALADLDGLHRGRLRLERIVRARIAGRADDPSEVAAAIAECAPMWAALLRGERTVVVAETTRVIDLGGRIEEPLIARALATNSVADLGEALRRRPNDAWLRWVRGTWRAQAGDPDGSAADLALAVALRPSLAKEPR